jgi:hypothetical protein
MFGMNRYKVRAQSLSAIGFLTQADHYHDYEFETEESLEAFAHRIAASGFFDESGQRWIMPGGIVWIERA